MSKTSFAVLTKARSKFGNRLTEKDYQSLLACQSVGEIMSYLKNNTHYSKALTDVSEREIHRGRLEALLRQNLFYEFDSLCRYDSSVSSGLSSYIISTLEVEQIIRFLILLSSNSTDKFIYQFPGYISKHTEIDVNKLANAKNYEEFLNATQSSQFYDILKQFSPDEKNRLPISDIENKLSPDDIKANLLLDYTNLSEKTVDMMCKAESSGEIFSIMQNTHNGRLIDKIGYVYASDISPRVKYRLARKNMHFSNNPSVVMISYIFVAETELMNIVTLIEGTRYELDNKITQSLLIK